MTAILILFIISFQAALVYFGVKWLSQLNNRLIELNGEVSLFAPKISDEFEKARNLLKALNKAVETYFKQQNKLKVYRNLMLVKSLVVAIVLYKKRKSILNFFSLYDIVSKFAKSILEF